MPQVLTNTRTKMVMKEETKKSKWHIRGKEFQKRSRQERVKFNYHDKMPVFK